MNFGPSMICTVGKIYTTIFPFFRKRVVNIVIENLGPVSNKSSGHFTFLKGFHEFLNSSIFEKITFFFKFYATDSISHKIL